jgi:hypothetical protein
MQPCGPWLATRAAYGERLLPQARHVAALPTATALLRLAPALLAAGAAVPASEALPRYIRDKVAQTTAEREALRAQAAAAPPHHERTAIAAATAAESALEVRKSRRPNT